MSAPSPPVYRRAGLDDRALELARAVVPPEHEVARLTMLGFALRATGEPAEAERAFLFGGDST